MAYVGAVLLSRWTVIVFNLLLTYVCLLAAFDVILMIFRQADHVIQMDVMDGMGVIMIGYGVALEERRALRALAGNLESINRHWEEAIDHHCHSQGLLLLVFGLFVEMCVACIEIPNHIVNTGGIERPVLGLSIFFLLLCVLVMLNYSWRMLVQRKIRPAPDIPASS